jgi:AcrR family transcriptional regulator
MMLEEEVSTAQTRDLIIGVTDALLRDGGRKALSTRAISSAAGVQPPVIYRLFGDKQGLLDEVAGRGFAAYLVAFDGGPTKVDPLDDLRAGWDAHIGFGLANPYLYSLVYGDPLRKRPSATALAAQGVVEEKVHRLAVAGRLAVSEHRAVQMLLAAGSGVTLTLIRSLLDERDNGLSETTREIVINAITGDIPVAQARGSIGAALAFRAQLVDVDILSAGERVLLLEILDRVITHSA